MRIGNQSGLGWWRSAGTNRKRTRFWRWAPCLVLFFALVAAMLLIADFDRPPRLIEISRQVVPPDELVANQGWVSDYEIAADGHETWLVIDIRTGRRLPQIALTENRLTQLHAAAQENMKACIQLYDRSKQSRDAADLLRVLPQGSRINGCVLSPRQDIRAWVVLARCTNLMDRAMALFHRSTQLADVSRFELWITDGQGKMPRLLGVGDRFATMSNDLLKHEITFPTIFWSPDSKHLSFEYHEALWAAPIQ